MCADIQKAAEVELASYMYDNEDGHEVLVKRLKGRAPFRLNVYSDSQTLAGRVPKLQRSRLAELLSSGSTQNTATVYVCKGSRGGSYNCKGVVVQLRGKLSWQRVHVYASSRLFAYVGPKRIFKDAGTI